MPKTSLQPLNHNRTGLAKNVVVARWAFHLALRKEHAPLRGADRRIQKSKALYQECRALSNHARVSKGHSAGVPTRTKMQTKPCIQTQKAIRAENVTNSFNGSWRLHQTNTFGRCNRVFQLPSDLISKYELSDSTVVGP